MQPRWQDVPADQLERIYNPRAAGPNVAAGRARRIAMSEQARISLANNSLVTEDLRYGQGRKQTLDLYRPKDSKDPAPLAVFVHGGYWRGGDKHETTLVAPALIDAGAVVANVNYDLCPDITLDQMVEQIIQAVRFCADQSGQWGANADQLVLIGHSAGAHLAARVMNSPADNEGSPPDLVHSVIALSGIYEPEVVTKISVNDEAQIDPDVARRNDCLKHIPRGQARYFIAAGGDEPAGWIEQSNLYARTVQEGGFDCHVQHVPGTDHFTMLCESFVPGSAAFAPIAQMLKTRS